MVNKIFPTSAGPPKNRGAEAMRQEIAHVAALRILGWLAGEDDLFPAFLGATGASLADLRIAADRPEFLVSVLDFVLQRDDWVVAAAAAADLRPEDIGPVRAALGGRDRMHWT